MSRVRLFGIFIWLFVGSEELVSCVYSSLQDLRMQTGR